MFRAKRIPGSICFESLKHTLHTLGQGGGHSLLLDFGCTASVFAYQ
jgi:hypothetical protein